MIYIFSESEADVVRPTDPDAYAAWVDASSGVPVWKMMNHLGVVTDLKGLPGTASDSFKSIVVAGSPNVVAGSPTDTLTLIAGANVTITQNPATKEITISATGGGAVISVAGKTGVVTLVQADIANLVTDLAGKAASVHGHAQSDVTGLVLALSGKEATGVAATLDAAHIADADPHTQYAKEADLGGAAVLNVGTIAGTVAAGNDSRFSDARTPTSHATSHALGGGDTITVVLAQLSDASADGRLIASAANYAAMRTLLGLVVGTNVQAYHTNLANVAAASGNGYLQVIGGVVQSAATTPGGSVPTGTGVRNVVADVEDATALSFADVGRLFMSGCYFGAILGNIVIGSTTYGLFMTSIVVASGSIASGIASGFNNGVLFTVTSANGSLIGMASASSSTSVVVGNLQLGTGKAYFCARVRFGATLSNGTNKYTYRAGFMALATGGSNGCWIDYTHDSNSGAWRAVAVAGGVSTGTVTPTTNITVAANTTYFLEIVVAADGSSAEYFVNGTSIAVYTANIPTASNTHVAAVVSLNRSAAGAANSTITQRECFWYLDPT